MDNQNQKSAPDATNSPATSGLIHMHGSFRSLLAKEIRTERHRYKRLGYEAQTPYSYGVWRGRLGLLKELTRSGLAKKNNVNEKDNHE